MEAVVFPKIAGQEKKSTPSASENGFSSEKPSAAIGAANIAPKFPSIWMDTRYLRRSGENNVKDVENPLRNWITMISDNQNKLIEIDLFVFWQT
jgi:hypothetical protein